MQVRISALWLPVILLAASVPAASAADAAAAEFFETRIRPLLVKNCYSCHAEAETSGLRLDSRDRILRGGSRGPAVVPGDPENSLLIQAAGYEHRLLKMPPTGRLPEADIAALRRWVAEGAVWPESPSEFFTQRVQPIFEQHCIACHAEKPMGGLRLDSAGAFTQGGDSGAAVTPGDPGASLLIQSVRQTHEKLRMPPAGKLSGDEIAVLEKWVADGAQWARTDGESESFEITAGQRAHWSFQPLQKTAPPPAAEHPIDAFIRERLAAEGLEPSPRAGKLTLLRRVTYDLTGLPPAVSEIEAFLADDSRGAFEKVVDRLLASPRYGERWGRHWMDVVRYADTAGDSADYPIPQIRLYRDYIIESFNEDKPYDRFIREQIAGGLLPAGNDEQRWENIVATGYLANARRFDVQPERSMYLTVEDAIENVGKVFLGLSVNCARCHDHKFDPISQKDYYALYGVFDSTQFPYAGSERLRGQWNLIPRDPEAFERWSEPVREEWNALHEELRSLITETEPFYRQVGYNPEDEQYRERRSEIGKKYSRVQELFKERRKLLEKLPPPPEAAFAVREGEPHDVPLLIRGEPDKAGEVVPRRFLEVLGGQKLENPQQSGRRELAEWIADPENPLTARVMVNRIWQYHFGRGLVGSTNDFGVRGEEPTHPELLDYLAARFIEDGWSVKRMHRLILSSGTYQQASAPHPRAAKVDPGNKLLWRFSRQRLDAEALRDSALFISGRLEPGAPERHPFPPQSEWDYTQHRPYHAVYESNRRSVYLMTQRIQKHPYLATFDGADPNVTTPLRRLTTNPIQSLFLTNSEFLHDNAAAAAQRLLAEADTDRERLRLAHLRVTGRPPAPEELEKAAGFLTDAQIELGRAGVPEQRHRLEALASYLRVLFSSNAFLFVD